MLLARLGKIRESGRARDGEADLFGLVVSRTNQCGTEARAQAILKEREKAAARAVAEQGDADRHVGEVVPLDDREEAGQQHLEGKCGGGNKADGGWRGTRADAPPLIGTFDLRP